MLEIKTLMVCNLAIASVFFVTFSLYALCHKPYPGFRLWTIGIFLHAVAFLLLVLHGVIPPLLSVVVANSILVLSVAIRLDAIVQFIHNTRINRLAYLVSAGIGICCYYYYCIHNDIGVCTVTVSLAICVFLAVLAYHLIRNSLPVTRILYYFGAGIVLVDGFSLLVRASRWYHGQSTTVFPGDDYDAIHFAIGVMSELAINIIFLMMNSQRAESRFFEVNKALVSSENRYKSLSDASFEGIVITHNGLIIETNDNACEMLGYASGEIIGQRPDSLVDRADRKKVNRNISIESEVVYEVSGRRKDGTTFPMEIRGRTFQYNGSNARVAALHDITKQKRIEEIAQERDRLYLTLFEMNTSIMLLIDQKTGQIVDANRAACDFYGYPKDRIKKLEITEINTLTKDEVFEEMDRAKNEERNYFNFSHRLANGEIHDVEVFTGPIRYKNQSLLCSIIHDITTRKKDEAEREQLITSLQKALQEIKTLQGILPICSHCKKVRDDEGSWSQIEHYVRRHSNAKFSHGICPDCVEDLYPEIATEVLRRI